MAEPLKGRRQISAVLVAGVIASVGLAVVPVIVTSTSGSFSLTVGLIGVCITLLLEVIVRIDRREKLVHRAFEMIDALDALDAVPTLSNDLQHSAIAAAAIMTGDSPPLFRMVAEQVISECRRQLDNLSHGECTVNTGSAPVLIDLARHAKTSIRATSIISGTGSGDEAWWSSPGGQEYWKENVRALKRKVSITRVYIFETPPTRQMTDILSQQEKAGVELLQVDRSQIPANLAMNVVIIDNKAVYEIVVNRPDNVLRTLHVNPAFVRSTVSKFDELVQRIYSRRFN